MRRTSVRDSDGRHSHQRGGMQMVRRKDAFVFHDIKKYTDLKGNTMGFYWLRYFPLLVGGIRSLDRFVLNDRMLHLGRRRSA